MPDRVESHLERGGREAAEQIEDDEAHVPHRVLDVVAEDPQEPHVADQVHPAAVHEHRRDDGVPGAACALSTQTEPSPIGKLRRPARCAAARPEPAPARTPRGTARAPCRSPEPAPRRARSPRSSRTSHGRREVGVVVADRKHASIVMKCRATGSQSLCRALEGRKAARRLTGNDCEPVARHSVGGSPLEPRSRDDDLGQHGDGGSIANVTLVDDLLIDGECVAHDAGERGHDDRGGSSCCGLSNRRSCLCSFVSCVR